MNKIGYKKWAPTRILNALKSISLSQIVILVYESYASSPKSF